MYPSILDRNKSGFLGLFWKAARIGTLSMLPVYMFGSKVSRARTGSLTLTNRITPSLLCTPDPFMRSGERLSPWVSMACVVMAIALLIGN